MIFTELTKEEFSKFAFSHPLNHYLQDVRMSEINNGWKTNYVGIKENGKIIAATRLLYRKTRLGYNHFYAVRGPLLDYNNDKILTFFTKEIKKYTKKKKGYLFRIDPALPYQSRDIDGNILKNEPNNQHVVDQLKSLGYHHSGFITNIDFLRQVRFVFKLDLENKTKEQLLNDMRPNTRNIIRKTLKSGIHLRTLSYEELPLFKKITEETSEIKEFPDKDLSYYQKMYELFSKEEQIQFVIAELHVEEYKQLLLEEKKSLEDRLTTISFKSEGKRKEIHVTIESLNKKLNQVQELEKEGTAIPLACAMFLLYQDEVIYSCSGSVRKYMSFNAQYFIQWKMIEYAKDHNFKKYNFYGISGNFDKKDPDYGIYEFKKGFNGYVEEYIGEFELPLNWYYFFSKIKNKIRK